MLVGVISDTHLFETALPREAVDALKGAELIIHAGDVVEISVIRELSRIAPVKAVRGNMDLGDCVRKHPSSMVLELGKHKVGVTHGSGPHNDVLKRVQQAFDGTGVDAVIFGHTHDPLITWKDGVLYFNPGSATWNRRIESNSVGLLEVGERLRPRIVLLDRD